MKGNGIKSNLMMMIEALKKEINKYGEMWECK